MFTITGSTINRVAAIVFGECARSRTLITGPQSNGHLNQYRRFAAFARTCLQKLTEAAASSSTCQSPSPAAGMPPPITASTAAAILGAALAASLLLLFTAEAEAAAAPDSLRLVTAVFRHGQRTPASTYPADPHINDDFFPVGWGALTNEGKAQQYRLGQFLRKRYAAFLSDAYSPKFVRAQSTDVDRTKMSLQLALAGLYPPTAAQRWSAELPWQPIPTHCEPLDEDKLLLVTVSCPRYYEALQEVTELPEVKQQIEKNHDIYTSLTSKSGMEVKTFNDLLSMQGTLRAESDLNLTLPEWTKAVYPEPLNTLAARSFILNTYTSEMKSIKGGPLLKRILDQCVAKANNTLQPSERQLYLYAGHDSTVAYLLSAFNVWEEQVPEYNSLILIELHQTGQNEHGIKILFRNGTDNEPSVLKLPGCGEICPLEQVLAKTKNTVATDLKIQCKPKDPNYIPPAAPEI